MNFLDNQLLSGTSTPPSINQPEPSLNDEVSQVIGQLGRFWGGLRRQSQTALQLARKDIGDAVSQAQRELGKLTSDAPKQDSTSSKETDIHDTTEDGEQEGSSSQSETPVATSSSSTERDLSNSSIFSRLQSALPPNLNNIPETLKYATENIDLSQLRTTLSNEFQRVQDATIAQAGEYVHRSEELLREVVKEAGEVLKDAVKVIPPAEGAEPGLIPPGPLWDGVDMWSLPSSSSSDVASGDGKDKAREGASSSGHPSGEAQLTTVTTRAKFLLNQLKHNPAIIRLDPETDDRVRELYRSWVATEVEANGGIEGNVWTGRISASVDEPGGDGGQALQSSLDSLVPSELTKDQFWKRYFFRVHQIEREEEKRKALLRGSIENEELFSWEDDEEEPTSPTPGAKSMSNSQENISQPVAAIPSLTSPPASTGVEFGKESAPTSQVHTPATSPRESSEDSYDLLSSENASVSGVRKETDRAGVGEDPDSDWE